MQSGPRGGKYYVSGGGSKVYRDLPTPRGREGARAPAGRARPSLKKPSLPAKRPRRQALKKVRPPLRRAAMKGVGGDKGRQKRLKRAEKAVLGAEKSYKRYERVKARAAKKPKVAAKTKVAAKPKADARKQFRDETKSDLAALRKKIIGTPKTKASKNFSSKQETVLSKMSPDRAERIRSIVTKKRAEKRELAGLKKEVARERAEQHAKGKRARAQEAKGRFDKLSPSNKESVRQRMAAKAGKARIGTGEPKEAPRKQRIDVGEPAKKKPRQRLRIATDPKKETKSSIEGGSAQPMAGKQISKGSTEAIQSTGTKKRRLPPRKKRKPLPKPRNPNPFLKKGGSGAKWAS